MKVKNLDKAVMEGFMKELKNNLWFFLIMEVCIYVDIFLV
jgi:hypothetical protein